MKTTQNQQLSYRSLVFVLSVVALVGFLAEPSFTRQRDEDRIVNAKRQAEVLGYQVFEIYREATQSPSLPAEIVNSRSPASIASMMNNGGESLTFHGAGSIGSDPWGQPYRYKILSATGDQLKVQIWSAGPNKAFETKDEPGNAPEAYVGDDVGIVLAMNNHPQE